jgi:outer membrane protein OmpA-like peptidoglycan-associated protein
MTPVGTFMNRPTSTYCLLAICFILQGVPNFMVVASAQTAMPTANATPVKPQNNTMALRNAVTDTDVKENLKIMASTQARLTALLTQGAAQGVFAPQTPAVDGFYKDYIWTKAQRWLDVAQDETRNNNRGAFPQAALVESHKLITLLEKGDTSSLLQGWDTPHIEGANKVRDDLWDLLVQWKQVAIDGAPVARAGARCALATSGYTEVQLVWAGWVSRYYGWRSALPFISHAERSLDHAKSQFIVCRDAAALAAMPKPAPAATPVAAVPPVIVPVVIDPVKAVPQLAAKPDNQLVFEHNSSVISVEAHLTLLRMFERWQATGSKQMLVLQGRVDDTGDGQENTGLMQARAKAVFKQLRTFGVPANRMHVLPSVAIKPSADTPVNKVPDPAKRTVIITLID